MNIEKINHILEKFHSLKNISASISIEANELLELFQWVDNKDSDTILENKLEKVKEEIADIGIYLLLFCKYGNINLEEVILDKIKKNSEKYPVSLAKGSSKKYDEFNQ